MKEQHIICVSFPAWDGDYVKSTVKLMCALSESNRVLFVDYAYTWKDVFKGIMGAHTYIPWKRVLGWEDRMRYVILPSSSICVLSLPPTIPYHWIKSFHWAKLIIRINAWFMKRCIKRAIRKLNLKNYTVVNALNPMYGLPLARKLGESRLIYYCYDEIGAAKWIARHGKPFEEKFLPRVDCVITTSHQLRLKKQKLQPCCIRIPNGVDLSLFEPKEPQSQETYRRAVVGYLGSIDDRLDTHLLKQVFEQMPDISFQFVGRISSIKTYNILKQYPNVQFHGPQPPEMLNSFLHSWDVGMIPFVRNEFTAGIYPMKINEYLATGLPVVSTRFGDMDDFESVAHICDTTATFMEYIVKELMESDTQKFLQRIAFAQSNTWKMRAADFQNVLNKHEISSSTFVV